MRLSTHTARVAPWSSATKRGENRLFAVVGSSSRRSMTSTDGHPARSSGASGTRSRADAIASRVGHGEIRTRGAPACRQRSARTSRACHVGACSLRSASSCSSTTIASARSGPGDHAAERVPTTTRPPAAARAHEAARTDGGPSAAKLSTARPERPSPAARRCAWATDGVITIAPAPAGACSSACRSSEAMVSSRSCAGAIRSTAVPPSSARSERDRSASPGA